MSDEQAPDEGLGLEETADEAATAPESPPETAPAAEDASVPGWVPVSLVAALLIGIGLGAGGTLLFSGDGETSDTVARAAEGPEGGGAAPVATIPQVGNDDPDAYGAVTVTGGSLPRLDGEFDTAVGMPIPNLAGGDFEGNRVEITNDGRAKIIVFLAHWCPYCQQEVPIVRDWIDTTELPPDVDVYSVSTLTDFTRGNYPPRTWFDAEGWNVPLIVDDASDTAATAFGLNAVPFWVLVSPDGTVAGRGAGGGVPADALTGIAEQLSAVAAPAEDGG